ncbi:hypothetical protein K402DRAFT_398059 [Aulographum hederae CBS 113979]|uniref:Uncharacterized protein n=1 Tax=Aulographum hederae CBS 113979 TaxID=1176131 RepID=A0A6G1GM53_9PEZI|nr:hypothetical protein K402DRAFT_398059 [Aulographum hederae CBS 113979]
MAMSDSPTTDDTTSNTPFLKFPPTSPITIHPTPTSGRAVFTTRPLSPGTTLLHTPALPIDVILREYRREVCGWCFHYDEGRTLPIKRLLKEVGFVFCGEECAREWERDVGTLGREAWGVVEGFVRGGAGGKGWGNGGGGGGGKGNGNGRQNGSGSKKGVEIDGLDGSATEEDADGDVGIPDAEVPRPGEEEIAAAWRWGEMAREDIVAARDGSRVKSHSKTLNMVLGTRPDADVLSFLLSGVLCRARSSEVASMSEIPQEQETGNEGEGKEGDDERETKTTVQDGNQETVSTTNSSSSTATPTPTPTSPPSPPILSSSPWSTILALHPSQLPYPSSPILYTHILTFCHLLALLPPPLLPFLTKSTCLATINRDACNSFGIRSLDDGGDEFFGYGVWPDASYFNHSCEPAVGKERVGREWRFWCKGAVGEGEEVGISYLGGEERDLGLAERRERLWTGWGFWCACGKCVREEREEVEKNGSVEGVGSGGNSGGGTSGDTMEVD